MDILLFATSWILVILSAVSTIVHAIERKYEHCAARMILTCLYLALATIPTLPIESARYYSRLTVGIMLLTEITSFYFRRGWRS